MTRGLWLVAILLWSVQAASACERYKRIELNSAQTLMDKLQDPTAKPLEQIYAFKELSCADEPTLRRLSFEEGIRSKQPMLRSQALSELLMQRESVTLRLTKTAATNAASQEWLKTATDTQVLKLKAPNRAMNCVTVQRQSFESPCPSEHGGAFFIDGEKVRLRVDGITGEFALGPDGVLRGKVKPVRNGTDLDGSIEIF